VVENWKIVGFRTAKRILAYNLQTSHNLNLKQWLRLKQSLRWLYINEKIHGLRIYPRFSCILPRPAKYYAFNPKYMHVHVNSPNSQDLTVSSCPELLVTVKIMHICCIKPRVIKFAFVCKGWKANYSTNLRPRRNTPHLVSDRRAFVCFSPKKLMVKEFTVGLHDSPYKTQAMHLKECTSSGFQPLNNRIKEYYVHA
jgi:hypothetical protein